MAVTRTTGGAGNDGDAGNGDVCMFVCLRVCVRVRVRVCVRVLVRRHVLRCWSAPQCLAFPQLLATPRLWFCGSCRCRGSFVAGFARSVAPVAAVALLSLALLVLWLLSLPVLFYRWLCAMNDTHVHMHALCKHT